MMLKTWLRLGSGNTGQVLPVFRGSGQVYLMHHSGARAGQTALDLGTGCGNLALAAACRGANVIAADIDDRALALAEENARANGLQSKVQFVFSDWFSELSGKRFDLLVSNPPFVPMPAGCSHVTHSYGGADGLRCVRSILSEAPNYLARCGRLQMLLLSVGTRDLPKALGDVAGFARARNAAVRLVRLYHEPLELRLLVDAYKAAAGWSDWRDTLLSEGHTHLHYFVVDAVCERGYSIRWLPATSTMAGRYWLNWEHWRSRFVWNGAIPFQRGC
jgi:SAM-dependent methyltransferase